MGEIWKDIAGYEGLYQVSNYGRVKSLHGKEKILKPGANGKEYLVVNLCKDGKKKQYTIHRLVLMNFNPIEGMGQLEVDHIDTNPSNNNLENLHWTTRKENRNNPLSKVHYSEAHKGKFGVNHHSSIPIVQLTIDGELVNVYGSACEAERSGFNNKRINDCTKGRNKTHGGYKWIYLHEYIFNIHPNIKTINLFNKTYEVNRR